MYFPINSAAGEIRLLILQPAKQLDDPLIGTLAHVLLSARPDYEALSYTWGGKGVGHSIWVNGVAFELFENLDAALRRLRLPKLPRALWIDAICINQHSIRERQEQISLMRQVYEQTRQVCIWLGEASEGSSLGMTFLRRQTDSFLVSTYKMYKERNKVGNKQFNRDKRDLQMLTNGASLMSIGNMSEEADLGEVREILARPWFSRVWVVQEAVLATNIVFMCGPETAPWDSIKKTIDFVQRGNSYTLGGIESFTLFGVPFGSTYKFPDENYNNLWRLREKWQSGERDKINVLEVLYSFRSLHCTDSRDRIYSFLGFAFSTLRVDIQPDYSAPINFVYQLFARQAIEATNSLDILNCRREWEGIKSQNDLDNKKPVYAYSVLDQGKYCDDFAFVVDGPGGKPRRDWARLPPGWERIASKSSNYFYNHNNSQTYSESPLDSQPPQLVEHFSKRRRAPPGWVKTWDNLGRVRVAYSPSKDTQPAGEDSLREELSYLASWVPSWATFSEYDPNLLLELLEQHKTRYWFTAGHDAVVMEANDLMPDELALEGMFFDEIEHLGPAWHPGEITAPISAARMTVFPEWKALWEAYAGPKSPYLDQDKTLEHALGTTVLADPWGETLTQDEAWLLFQTWMEGEHWDTAEEPVFTSKNVADVIRNVIAFGALEDRMGEYYGRIANPAAYEAAPTVDDETASTLSGQSESSATGTTAKPKFSLIDDFSSLSVNSADGKWSYRTHFVNMMKEGYHHDNTPEQPVLDRYGRMILRIYACCANRAYFLTKKGYMGLAPWNARAGDCIYSLKGGKTPYILRRAPEGYFTLVGEVYVNDPMRGMPLPHDTDARSAGWQTVRLV